MSGRSRTKSPAVEADVVELATVGLDQTNHLCKQLVAGPWPQTGLHSGQLVERQVRQGADPATTGNPFEFEIDLPVQGFGRERSGDRVPEQLGSRQRRSVHAYGQPGDELVVGNAAADDVIGPTTERLENHRLISPIGHHNRRNPVAVGVRPQLVEDLEFGAVELVHSQYDEAQRGRFESDQCLRCTGRWHGNPASGFDRAAQLVAASVVVCADEHRALARVKREPVGLNGKRGGKLHDNSPSTATAVR